MAKVKDKRDMSALMEKNVPAPMKRDKRSGKRTTIEFSPEDEAEIFRIQDVLQAKGVRVNETRNIVRMALRVAFKDPGDDELEEIHNELAIRWRRGGAHASA